MQRRFEVLRFGPTNAAHAERAALIDELAARCDRLVIFHEEPTIIAPHVPRTPQEDRQMVHGRTSIKRALSCQLEVMVMPPGPAGVLGARLMSLEKVYKRARDAFLRLG